VANCFFASILIQGKGEGINRLEIEFN